MAAHGEGLAGSAAPGVAAGRRAGGKYSGLGFLSRKKVRK